ncbi:Crp/Fnr family transcriptional regulator [Flavobacterium sp.]|uniref:Crp/Fnr family transcriptional regulator n=1 Tax=Flavobacterium sp. TaxID=239 RepID=UPI001228B5F3|nr:Crp/Fnr family transcriptional regulator [Flavobacterium sp.]RZJ73003.1 MAG: Crp/Fnr family transcriptional regulator [Flavobacterium sp.]
MEKFIAFVLQFGNLNKLQLDLIIAKSEQIQLKKDNYFSQAGQIPKQVGFVVKGVMRGCYYDKHGQEITRCFIPEDNLVVDYPNFESGLVSTENIQAATDCELITFAKQDWDELSRSIAGWDNMKNKMVQLCMYQKSRKGPVISHDATSRYLEFLKNYPSLVNQVPLVHIASYLGVTQQSLSRIRKNIG